PAGPPWKGERGAWDAGGGSGGAADADASFRPPAVVRARPVTTRPATNPAATSASDSVRFRPIIGSAHGDATRAPIGGLRQDHGEHAVFEIGLHRLDVNRLGQREAAREAAVAEVDAGVL